MGFTGLSLYHGPTMAKVLESLGLMCYPVISGNLGVLKPGIHCLKSKTFSLDELLYLTVIILQQFLI